MRIRLIGQRNSTGIGIHYASFADELQQLQYIGSMVEEIDFKNNDQIYAAIADSRDTDINISFVGVNLHQHFKGVNIQWIVFESTLIPGDILATLHGADQVWTPSEWGRITLVANGIRNEKIRVVPEGVNGRIFHNYGKKPWTNTRPFRFLMVGKYEQRKSFDETLDAFAQVHGNHPDIELVIKSSYFTNHDQKLQQLQKKITSLGLNNVTLLWGGMEVDKLAELYRSCDIFVLPSKGEGWGLPLLEAAASGMPIITTFYSGHTEFLNPIRSSVVDVDYVMTEIACPEYCSYYSSTNGSWGQWARPDIFSIANCMQGVCREYAMVYENAQKNSHIIRQRFSWANSVDSALVAMESVARF